MKYKEGQIVHVRNKTAGSSYERAKREAIEFAGKEIAELPLRIFTVLEYVYGLEYKREDGKVISFGDFAEEDVIGLWCEEIEAEDF